MSLLQKDQLLDGYRLIRVIGQGGFGEVWLCRSEAMGDYRALKFIPARDTDLLEKEHHALGEYRKAAAQLRSPHLMPIEHVNRHEHGLFSVMPLADGNSGLDPADESWRPWTLGSLLRARAAEPAWLSSGEIVLLIIPLLEALQTLSAAGLVHRDVKPENILFFDGRSCLSDISLLGADSMENTRRGTPGYAAPSWYAGGHVDMYGAAATMYTLLTGNSPDRMGRSAFNWPPQGEASMPESERAEWKRLHAVIRRAVEERPDERYLDFKSMASAIQGQPAAPPEKFNRRLKPLGILICIAAATVILLFPWLHRKKASQAENPAFDGSGVAVAARIPIPNERGDEERKNLIHLLVTGPLGNYQTLPVFDAASDKQREAFHAMWSGLDHSLGEGNYQIALKEFALLSEIFPQLALLPTARLAKLLLEQSSGNQSAVDKGIVDPALTAFHSDDIDPGWRVRLFGALGYPRKGEEYLTNLLETASPEARPEYYRLRGEMRVQQGDLSGCQEDRDSAFQSMPEDFSERTLEEIKWEKLEQEFPAFGEYRRILPEK
ncbi:serine/threonine protein kinase [Luteolibacter flavescens]|uniref:Serine/threonine protein kinase n=1 Tax=Luteolibacter flavescens TaxID=1859460 RepID=A0ABT3FT27_9BACT|nr:serine/threonine-protein kinase [Luteolibacter flavescens]MCW1886710.1 serine/threonine protein kinase [Luteolibacter flavescens]